MLIALPGAYVFARYEFPGQRLISALAIVPFVLPTVVVAAAFLALLGSRSPLGIRLDHTIFAILAAHVFYNYAVVLRARRRRMGADLDPRLEDAARVLGASRWQAFRRVTLPLLRPAIASAASIVFLFTFTSFGVILLLGGPAVRDARGRDLPTDGGAARPAHGRRAVAAADDRSGRVAFRVLALPAAQRDALRVVSPPRSVARRPRTREGARGRGCATSLVVAVVLGVPLAVLIERSLRGPERLRPAQLLRRCSRRSQRSALFVPPIEAVQNSLVFALIATLICAPLGLMAAVVIARGRGRLASGFDALLMLPLGTSAVIVGFGFLVALGNLPFDLRTSIVLIPIAHAIVALPFLVRAVRAGSALGGRAAARRRARARCVARAACGARSICRSSTARC